MWAARDNANARWPKTLVAAGGVEIRKLGLHLHLIAQKRSGIHTGNYQDKPLCRQRDGK